MKRITAILLALAMLLGMTCVAAAEDAVTLSVGSINGEIGDIVQVPVTVSENHYLVNGFIFLIYDPEVLELQEVCDDEDNPYFETVNTAIFDSSFMWAFNLPEAGKAKLVFSTVEDTGNAAGGVLFTLTFKLLKTVDNSALVLTVPEMCANSGGDDVDVVPTLVNGTVKVTPVDTAPVTKGDVNRNGIANLADAVLLCYYLNGTTDLNQKQKLSADVNDDGEITILDASRLFYFASGRMAEL